MVIRLVCVAVLGILPACASMPESGSSLPEGFKPASSNFGVLVEAVEVVNQILGPGSGTRLVVCDTRDSASENEIAVLLVDPPEHHRGMVCMVPRGKRLILVEDAAVPQLPMIFSKGFQGGIDVDLADILAVCLLHEFGHIWHRHYAMAMPQMPAIGFNVVNTRAKNIEDEADEVAARVIREAFQQLDDAGRMIDASNLQVALMNVSWNLMGYRILDNFGSTVLRRPEVLADDSMTHYNLELRFLRINYLVSGSDASKELLDEFYRLRGGIQVEPRVLYSLPSEG